MAHELIVVGSLLEQTCLVNACVRNARRVLVRSHPVYVCRVRGAVLGLPHLLHLRHVLVLSPLALEVFHWSLFNFLGRDLGSFRIQRVNFIDVNTLVPFGSTCSSEGSNVSQVRGGAIP